MPSSVMFAEKKISAFVFWGAPCLMVDKHDKGKSDTQIALVISVHVYCHHVYPRLHTTYARYKIMIVGLVVCRTTRSTFQVNRKIF